METTNQKTNLVGAALGLGILFLTVYIIGKAWKASQK